MEYEPKIYTIRLPPLVDAEAGEVHTATIRLPLYEPQADYSDMALTTDASRLVVSRKGIEILIHSSILRYTPERWAKAFDALGLSDNYEDGRAVAALRAVSMKLAELPKRRGERGAGLQDQQKRDFLIAAALVGIANGESFRKATCAVLADHQDIVPWSFDTAENTLLTAVKRHLRGEP